MNIQCLFPDLILYLDGYGISVERKTVYEDIETLRIFGMKIENRRRKPSGYYLADRDFSFPELKIIMDAVQSSRFITERQSRELVRKLEHLTSISEAKRLQSRDFGSSGNVRQLTARYMTAFRRYVMPWRITGRSVLTTMSGTFPES